MSSARALLALTVVAILSFGAIAGWSFFGVYGDCRNDGECAAGQQCVPVVHGYDPWWARGRTYRMCVMTCKRDQDCPGTLTCNWVSHGPIVPFCSNTSP